MIKKSEGRHLTSTLQTVYTVPNGKRADWMMLWVSNTSGSNASLTATYYNKANNATLTMFDDYTITSKDFFQVGGATNEFVCMKEGDYIQLSTTQDCTAIISVYEYNDIIQGG